MRSAAGAEVPVHGGGSVCCGSRDRRQHLECLQPQTTLPEPSSLTHEVAAAAYRLFVDHWSGLPISRLTISISQLTDDSVMQLTLFDDRMRSSSRERAIDQIKNRYGSGALIRASSLLESGVALERAQQIGGHYK